MSERSVGVALVGYGYWGANLARNIAAVEQLDLVGVADGEPGQVQKATATHGCAGWSSLEEALADDRVEAVVLATPAGTHAELALTAMGTGRHVLVEKPLATDPAGAEEITRLSSERGLVAMVGHTFLYSPAVWALKDYIVRGELGTPQYLYSQRLSLGRVRRDCSALWNFAPHDVSILLYLLDEQPVRVSGTSMSMIDPAVPDVYFARLEFPSGVGAHLHVSWIDPRKTRLMTVVGDRKMAVYDDVSVDQKLAVVDAGVARGGDFGEYLSLGDFQWRTRAGDILIPRIEMTEPLRNEVRAFAAAVLGGDPPIADARHGAEVVRILAAIDESARAGGVPVEVSR